MFEKKTNRRIVYLCLLYSCGFENVGIYFSADEIEEVA